MSVIKELDPKLHLKLIEGFEDELSPEYAKLESFYQANRRCKRCDSTLEKHIDTRIAWAEGNLLPKALLTCRNCGFTIDPHTGLIVDTGKASKIQTPDERAGIMTRRVDFE